MVRSSTLSPRPGGLEEGVAFPVPRAADGQGLGHGLGKQELQVRRAQPH